MNRHPLYAQRYRYALIVNLILPLAGMSTDIYLPSLPAMTQHFCTASSLVQLTVSAFVIALGFGQFISGPLSDALGRKRLIIGSLWTQLFAIIGILLVPNIIMVMILRFIQGLAAAFMNVPARAMLNDLFSGEALRKQFNLVTIIYAVSPIIAPFIGGLLQHHLFWQANFMLLFCYATGLLIVFQIYFHDTIVDKQDFSIARLWQNYRTILSHRHFVACTLMASFFWGFGAIFSSIGPFLVQVGLGYSADAYGVMALLIGLAWFVGTSVSRLLFKIAIPLKMPITLTLMLLTAAVFFAISRSEHFTIYQLVIPTFVLVCLSGFSFPIFVGECMVLFREIAGSANACLFGMIWLGFSGFTLIAATLKTHSLRPLGTTYLILAAAMCVWYAFGVHRKVKA